MRGIGLLGILLLTGCLVIPVPTPHGQVQEGSRVEDSQLTFLTIGVTHKKEVQDKFGRPEIFWRDENTFVYRWIERRGMLIWAVFGAGEYGGGAAGGAVDINGESAFLVKFDQNDVYLRSQILKKPAGKSFGKFLLDWRDAEKKSASAKKG